MKKFTGGIFNILALVFLSVIHSIGAVTDGEYVQNMEEFAYLAHFTMFAPYDFALCTGSILSRNYILTAAHCFRFAALRPSFNAVVKPGIFTNLSAIDTKLAARVRVGQADITSPNVISVNVSQLAVPPGYPYPNGVFVNNNPLTWEKDMVLLKLAEPLKFSSTVKPVKLLNEKGFEKLKPEETNKCNMTGWGSLLMSSNKLITGTWKIACNDVCAYGAINYYDYWQNKRNYSNTPYDSAKLGQVGANMTEAIEQGMICGAPNPSNMEGGNSGGPAVVKTKNGKTYQIGVVSNNFSETTALDCPRGKAFVFTRPSVECDWIRRVTKGEVRCYDYNG